MRTCVVLLFAIMAMLRPSAAEPVVVAGIGGQPPFAEVVGDGRLTGLEADLVATLCARLPEGCTVIAATSWNDLVTGLREGRYAIGFGGLSTATLDSLGIAASTPYLPLLAQRAVIARLAGADDPLESEGAIVGVMRGTPHALWLEAGLPPERVHRFADEEEMFLSLHTGSVDAVFGDGLILWRDLINTPLGQGVVLIGPGIDVENDGLALALANDTTIAAGIENALAQMRQDGSLASLLARYLPGLPLP